MIPVQLCQGDSRWNKVHLKGTDMTVGRWGCTITCLSMASDYFQKAFGVRQFKNPGELANELTFTKGGLIVWSSSPVSSLDAVIREMMTR
jgi:hypothetical protein